MSFIRHERRAHDLADAEPNAAERAASVLWCHEPRKKRSIGPSGDVAAFSRSPSVTAAAWALETPHRVAVTSRHATNNDDDRRPQHRSASPRRVSTLSCNDDDDEDDDVQLIRHISPICGSGSLSFRSPRASTAIGERALALTPTLGPTMAASVDNAAEPFACNTGSTSHDSVMIQLLRIEGPNALSRRSASRSRRRKIDARNVVAAAANSSSEATTANISYRSMPRLKRKAPPFSFNNLVDSSPIVLDSSFDTQSAAKSPSSSRDGARAPRPLSPPSSEKSSCSPNASVNLAHDQLSPLPRRRRRRLHDSNNTTTDRRNFSSTRTSSNAHTSVIVLEDDDDEQQQPHANQRSTSSQYEKAAYQQNVPKRWPTVGEARRANAQRFSTAVYDRHFAFRKRRAHRAAVTSDRRGGGRPNRATRQVERRNDRVLIAVCFFFPETLNATTLAVQGGANDAGEKIKTIASAIAGLLNKSKTISILFFCFVFHIPTFSCCRTQRYGRYLRRSRLVYARKSIACALHFALTWFVCDESNKCANAFF